MDFPFRLRRVYFEPAALKYPRGEEIYRRFKDQGIPLFITPSHNRVHGIPGRSSPEAFAEAKQTLVIGVRRPGPFQTCRPSAHYQLPLATGCPGRCRYCYLHTTLGRKPYLRAYVNVEEILERAGDYITRRKPAETLFEGAAVSDPLFIEPLTGGLSAAIRFFSRQELGRFRLVTKYTAVEAFLNLPHRGRTRFRFSISDEDTYARFEKGTPAPEERLRAARLVIAAGYPCGFLLAPLFLEGNWRNRFRELLRMIKRHLGGLPGVEGSREGSSLPALTFELITHRFTARARSHIEAVFPDHGLDMDPGRRRFKYGQFGYGKYLYPAELMREAETLLRQEIASLFPGAVVEYFV